MFGKYIPPEPEPLNIHTIEDLSEYIRKRLDEIEKRIDKIEKTQSDFEEDVEEKYKVLKEDIEYIRYWKRCY